MDEIIEAVIGVIGIITMLETGIFIGREFGTLEKFALWWLFRLQKDPPVIKDSPVAIENPTAIKIGKRYKFKFQDDPFLKYPAVIPLDIRNGYVQYRFDGRFFKSSTEVDSFLRFYELIE